MIVTTHFPALKELALEDPRMTNASVGYDADTFDPTFHLIIGIWERTEAYVFSEAIRVGAAGAESFSSVPRILFVR